MDDPVQIFDPATPVHLPRRRRRSMRRWSRLLRRLPIPTLGRYTPGVAFGGFVLWLMGLGAVSGVLFYTLLTAGLLNPTTRQEVLAERAEAPDVLDLPVFLPTQNSRTTILLMGADTRPSEYGYRTPTDSMMLVTIDTDAKTIGILSIPRDLYVDISGYGMDRINTAYVKGGGVTAMETIEDTLGVEVDGFVLIQFQAFMAVVDEIGGIDLYVPYTIDDPEFPAECDSRGECGFDPLYVEAGQQHMDGWTALRFARTRHGDTDFERARRQQMVMLAVRDKVVSLQILPTLIGRLPTLMTILGDTVRTDLSPDTMIELARAAYEVPDENIQRAVIDSNYVTPTRSPEGASVLVLNEGAAAELVALVFGEMQE